MKALIFVLSLSLTAQSFAQDSAKVKLKEWLGVLTLTNCEGSQALEACLPLPKKLTNAH